MAEWITVKEAARIRQCSDRTILRLIHDGKLEGRKDGRSWLVKVDPADTVADRQTTQTDAMAVTPDTVATLTKELERLREELHEAEKKVALVDGLTKDKERLQGQNDKLQEEMSGVKERSDTIILQLTRHNQLLLEDKSGPWYRRIFRKNRKPEQD